MIKVIDKFGRKIEQKCIPCIKCNGFINLYKDGDNKLYSCDICNGFGEIVIHVFCKEKNG